MRQKTKSYFIIFFIFFLIIILIVGWFYYKMTTSRERQNNDISECEKTIVITGKPSFCLKKESNGKILELNIYLLRNNKKIKDTILVNNIQNTNEYFIFNIPFDEFLKTDIVIVKAKNLTYKISEFGYSSDGGHWGMFGYLGDNNCYLDYDEIIINGKKYEGIK
jgi:hypothetical protein